MAHPAFASPNHNRATPTEPLQPSLVNVLRLYAIFQVVKGIVLLLLASIVNERLVLVSFVPLTTAFLFLGFVFSGMLRTTLGKWYLLVTVLLATIDTLTTKGAFWYWLATNRLLVIPPTSVTALPEFVRWFVEGTFIAGATVQPFVQMSMLVSLLLLLIVVSWQYDFRYAIAYTVLTTALDLWLNVFGISSTKPQLFFDATIISGRAFIFLVLGHLIVHLIGIQRKQQQSLVAANAALIRHVTTVEELTISHERNRLARELHDTLAHTLSAASVQLEAAHALWHSDGARAHTLLTQALDVTRSGLSETRRALKALRASPLDDLGLALALKELGEVTQQRSGAQVNINLPQRFEPIALNVEQALYRAAQEAFENIVRHAQANRVDLTLKQHHATLNMTIKDNGIGFNVVTAQDTPEHYGLAGMVERIESLGGHVTLSSQPTLGTCIEMEVTSDDHSYSVVR